MKQHRKSRMPEIGDLIIKTCQHRGTKHMGLVREIQLDSWGHQRCVLIEWSAGAPQGYQEEYGYGGTNIHNLRSEFEIIRGGESIP